MELYHLKTFVTVAEEGHLTRAAERLHTSQPAISAHIKTLEEELNIQLFNRTPKGMQLTTQGHNLLSRAQQTLASASEFAQLARSMQDELVGSIRVGLNNDAEFLRLPQLQRYMTARYPNLALNFMAGMSETNIQNVRTGRMDCAFTSGPCEDHRMDTLFLHQVELCVAAPASWKDRITLPSIKVLADLPWVYTSPNCAYFCAIQSLFDAHGYSPEKVLASDQEDALHSMVKAGIGIGIMRKDIAVEGQQKGYFYIPEIEIPSVELNFIYPKKRAHDPVILAFIDALTEAWNIQSAQSKQQQTA